MADRSGLNKDESTETRASMGPVKAAFEAGRAAKVEGKGLDSMPGGYATTRSLAKSWKRGWEEEARVVSVTVQRVEVVVREPEIRAPGEYLEASKPMPEVFVRPRPVPCQRCRLIRLPDRGQAVMVTGTWEGFVYLECKGCQHRFKMRVVIA
jgi:hypothetical protein